jgi:hypothetical protein
MIMAMCEKFGTSGTGVGVGSRFGIDVNVACTAGAGVDVGRGKGATGESEGVDPIGVGWQAEARNDARTVIQNRRVLHFMLGSFFTDYKSKIQMH